MHDYHGRLNTKRVIVTGAGSGIGLAISLRFVEEGAKVAMTYLKPNELRRARSLVSKIGRSGKAMFVRADIRRPEDVDDLIERTVEHFGGIDVLVANAGICPWHDFLRMPLDIWEETQAVNQRGTFLCCQAVARQMIRQHTPGSIVIVGSVGAYTGSERQADYNASKAAIGSLMRSIAVALGPYQIRSNAILPGCIRTQMNAKQLKITENTLCKRTPLGRIGRPEDIVGAAVYFASDESSFCTGSELRIDGGITINV